MSARTPIRESRLFSDPVSVLDATLRDAGYLNQWAFSRAQIFDVVGGVAKAGAEAIEVGYVSDDPSKPPAARCDAALLAELNAHIDGAASLAVMISLSEPDPDALFASRRDQLDLVRIPCTIEQVPQALGVAAAVRRHGIAASLNLVNISTLSPEQLTAACRDVTRAGVADILYLADSRGACRPEEVAEIVTVVRRHWSRLLGFHAHNNTGFAIVNPLVALDNGCGLIDGTVNGLGLGSGNTQLLHALAIVRERCPDKRYDLAPLAGLRHRFHVDQPAEHSYLYYLVGAKNLAQLWVEPLLERYGQRAAERLARIPRRAYTHIDQVIAEIEA